MEEAPDKCRTTARQLLQAQDGVCEASIPPAGRARIHGADFLVQKIEIAFSS